MNLQVPGESSIISDVHSLSTAPIRDNEDFINDDEEEIGNDDVDDIDVVISDLDDSSDNDVVQYCSIMSTDVARSHGGDGGSQPPPGPSRIPTTCEAVQAKKTRSKSKSLNLEEAFENNKRKPLEVTFDVKGGTLKAVGDNGKLFIRLIGNIIGFNVPPYYGCWENVPKEYKMPILPKLDEYFHLDRSWPYWHEVLSSIDNECKTRYKDRKSRHKQHFKDVGGYDDVEKAKKNPPEGLDAATWDKLISHFLDPKHIERSKKNAANRAKHLYPSLQGSSSYASHRYKRMNQETKELPSIIDTWHDMHHRTNGGWVNDTARAHYEKLCEERTTQTQNTLPGDAPIDEIKIVTKVLGKRRDCIKGVGRKLKGTPAIFASSSQSPLTHATTSRPQMPQEFVQGVAQTVNAVMKRQNNNLQAIRQLLQTMCPTATIPEFEDATVDVNELVQTIMAQFQSQQQPQQHSESNGEDDTDLGDD
ncbi:hypothetical protein F8388_025467 [Cannabis sativa]|uniref:Transposase n=1 Tax=Cannabis sativa TaxID=3483 RepID=A0A7J6G0W7_CANSA|nr:hypothetical protein F8388_025467 [Cannabis sativa]